MIEILDLIEKYSGILCFLVLLLLCIMVSVYGGKIVKEIKFLFRRSEILDVNDNLRHVPRDLKTDYFHKTNE